ncbi:MAG TPA: hypothetical protein VLA43_10940, partial [Longimicrobiales bacterium]|nr:hypothetical protein [Longimicrobiales bacterium]
MSLPPRIRRIQVSLAAFVSLALLPSGAGAQTLPELVRNRIEAGRVTSEFHVEGDRVLAVGAVPEFYLRREYRMAWVSPAGTVAPRADSLLVLLGEAATHGLDGSDYHARPLAALLDRVRRAGASPDPADLAELELLLTDAFLVYGSHLLLGRIDPERVEAEWIANRRDADLVLVLEEALARRDLRGALTVLAP